MGIMSTGKVMLYARTTVQDFVSRMQCIGELSKEKYAWEQTCSLLCWFVPFANCTPAPQLTTSLPACPQRAAHSQGRRGCRLQGGAGACAGGGACGRARRGSEEEPPTPEGEEGVACRAGQGRAQGGAHVAGQDGAHGMQSKAVMRSIRPVRSVSCVCSQQASRGALAEADMPLHSGGYVAGKWQLSLWRGAPSGREATTTPLALAWEQRVCARNIEGAVPAGVSRSVKHLQRGATIGVVRHEFGKHDWAGKQTNRT